MDKNISSSVRDYYDLLFDYVSSYKEMNENIIDDLLQEKAELHDQLINGGPNIDRDDLSRQIMGKSEEISKNREYLQSDALIKDGFKMAAEMIYDNEPELSDPFLEAPISEKYNYLMDRFAQEYVSDQAKQLADAERKSVEACACLESHCGNKPTVWENIRSLGAAEREWGARLKELRTDVVDGLKKRQRMTISSDSTALVYPDAEHAALKKMTEYFPEIVAEHKKQQEQEYAELLRDDPVKLYADLVARYSNAYSGEVGSDLATTRNALESKERKMSEHENAKPGTLENLVSFGRAQESWNREQAMMQKEQGHLKNEVARLADLKEDVKGGWISETARTHAKQFIKDEHPEVVNACDSHMMRHWKDSNNARLERQHDKQNNCRNDIGKTPDR